MGCVAEGGWGGSPASAVKPDPDSVAVAVPDSASASADGVFDGVNGKESETSGVVGILSVRAGGIVIAKECFIASTLQHFLDG